MNKLNFVNLGIIFNQNPQENKKNIENNFKKHSKQPNSYFLFCKSRRTQLHVENPSLPSREVTKILANEWKNLNIEEKNKYTEEYQKLIEKNNIESKELIEDIPMMVGILSLDGNFLSLPTFMISKPLKQNKKKK